MMKRSVTMEGKVTWLTKMENTNGVLEDRHMGGKREEKS